MSRGPEGKVKDYARPMVNLAQLMAKSYLWMPALVRGGQDARLRLGDFITSSFTGRR